jgi:ketosteroid isomerase-like protein
MRNTNLAARRLGAGRRASLGTKAVVGAALPVLMLLGACTSAQEETAVSSSPSPGEANGAGTCATAVDELFDALLAGSAPDELAQRFDEDVDWSIPGDTEAVPWIGPRQGRAGVADFYSELGQMAKVNEFEFDTIVGEGDRCVALGSLSTEVLETGRDIETDFAYDIEVRDGLITRYHMFEDSWAVAEAMKPQD